MTNSFLLPTSFMQVLAPPDTLYKVCRVTHNTYIQSSARICPLESCSRAGRLSGSGINLILFCRLHIQGLAETEKEFSKVLPLAEIKTWLDLYICFVLP